MYGTLGVLFILAVSSAHEPYDSTHIRSGIIQWVEQKTSQLVNEVNDAAAEVQQLVEKASSPRVKKVLSLLEKHQEYMGSCHEMSNFALSEGNYCINITGDVANLTELAYYGYELLSDLGDEVANLLDQLNQCQGLSIFKQISCYKQAFADIQKAIKEYTITFSQFLRNITEMCKDVEIDISKCFSFSQSAFINDFEKKIELCKLN